MCQNFLVVFFLLRPLLSIPVDTRLFGVDLLDIFTLAFSGAFLFCWLTSVLIRRAYLVSSIDVAILVFIFWCLLIHLLYIDRSNISDVIKFILPPLSFVLIRPFIEDAAKYRVMVLALVIGSAAPVLLCIYKIMSGTGLDVVNYWTGIPRYLGVYKNSHDFGHAMTCFLMAGGIYYGLSWLAPEAKRLGLVLKVGLVIIVAITLYCLYKSVVRTAYLGLIIFAFTSLFYLRRRLFFGVLFASIAGFLIMLPLMKLIFIDVTQAIEGEQKADVQFASGRPEIWQHNLEIFSQMRFDQWLAGVGVGYRKSFGEDDIWNSHNDFLEVMIQTGIIGLMFYCIIQLLFLWYILRMKGREKYLFLALFLAVTAMNLMSNSYVSRFSVGQIYYMLMAYVGSIAHQKACKLLDVSSPAMRV